MTSWPLRPPQQQPRSYRGGDDDDDEMSVLLVEETGVPRGNYSVRCSSLYIFVRSFIWIVSLNLIKYYENIFQVKFLEVSHLSFVFALGAKNREGLVKKRSGGRSMKGWCTCCGRCLQNMTAHYNNRWDMLRSCFQFFSYHMVHNNKRKRV